MSEDASAATRKTLKLLDPRPAISGEVLNNYIIQTNIPGMCVPLPGPLFPAIYSTITEQNLFPYKDSRTGDMGFLLAQTVTSSSKKNNVYSSLPNADWRSILNGKKLKLRPGKLEDVRKKNNKVQVTTREGKQVEICYWPDSFYRERINGAERSQKKRRENKEKKEDASEQSEGDGESRDSSDNVEMKAKEEKEKKKSGASLSKKNALESALSPENDREILQKATQVQAHAGTSMEFVSNGGLFVQNHKVRGPIFANGRAAEPLEQFALMLREIPSASDSESGEEESEALPKSLPSKEPIDILKTKPPGLLPGSGLRDSLNPQKGPVLAQKIPEQVIAKTTSTPSVKEAGKKTLEAPKEIVKEVNGSTVAQNKTTKDEIKPLPVKGGVLNPAEIQTELDPILVLEKQLEEMKKARALAINKNDIVSAAELQYAVIPEAERKLVEAKAPAAIAPEKNKKRKNANTKESKKKIQKAENDKDKKKTKKEKPPKNVKTSSKPDIPDKNGQSRAPEIKTESIPEIKGDNAPTGEITESIIDKILKKVNAQPFRQ